MKLRHQLFCFFVFLLILDAWVSTPYALTHVAGAYEANFFAKAGIDKFGLNYLWVSSIGWMILLFFVLEGADITWKRAIKACAESKNTWYTKFYRKYEKKNWFRELLGVVFMLKLILFWFYVVLNNFTIIFRNI